MKKEEIETHLKRRPAVHELVIGAFIQEPLFYSDNIFAVPLKAIGYEMFARYLVKYSIEIGKANVDKNGITSLINQGINSLPVIAIICFLDKDDSPENLELNAIDDLLRAKEALSWSSGERMDTFGYLILDSKNSFFRLTPPNSRKRTRLGFGNTGSDYLKQIQKIIETSKNDEHFSYALSIFKDANFESNQKFKIARYFNCLECLASNLKKSIGSRKAVKILLGLENGAISEININGKKYRYDVIEISGRIRDKLFHGKQFVKKDLNTKSRDAFELYDNHPEKIAESIQGYCEIEIAKWANGASNGIKNNYAQHPNITNRITNINL
ncbi:hypothetical protein [Polaribacter sp. Hel_I_88]|uniref:hypothetical protein n=1 Tax=Polaribacter sp. Hel_I_88 TaxID=1250006 RepID=UPI00047BFC9D|nr:hypothetical protein [Polaribacter sp. Hel_I_88]